MTKSDLAVAVLRRLNIIGAGESASADDEDLVTEKYESLYPQLRKLGLAPWSEASIDTWAETGLTDIVAAQVGPEFGWSDRMQTLLLWDKKGRQALAAQIQEDKRNAPVKADFF